MSRFDEAPKKNAVFKDVIMCSCEWELRPAATNIYSKHISCFVTCSREHFMWITEPEFTSIMHINNIFAAAFHCFYTLLSALKIYQTIFYISIKWNVSDLWDCFFLEENTRKLTPWPFLPTAPLFLLLDNKLLSNMAVFWEVVKSGRRGSVAGCY